MKIRVGFVSNSSTSSFIVVGYKFLFDSLDELEKFEKILGNCQNLSLDVQYGPEYDEYIVLGLEPTKMKENETLLQFKQRIVYELNKLNIGEFSNKIRQSELLIDNIDFISDCWYDG